jgi:50S ribosomal subunit-associated GTPase HflX
MVFNKIDASKSFDKEKVSSHVAPYPSVFLSSKTHEGIEELMDAIVMKMK